MRAQFVLSEIGTGLRRNLTMTIAVVVAVAISLALLGFSLLVREQVDTMKGFWYDKVEVAVFLCGETSDAPSCADGAVTGAQRDQILSDLQQLPQVQKVYYESKAEAFTHFKQQFKDSGFVESIDEEQMPESYRVKLENPEQFPVVKSAFSGRPGIELVQDQRELLERFFQVLNVVQWFVRFLAVVLSVVALLLITNTIRVAAFSRRRETGIMRLVGASNFYIQLPFILEGAIAGFIGAAFASVGLVAVQQFLVEGQLRPNFGGFMAFIGWEAVLTTIPLIILVGVGMTALASFFTLRRYLHV
ncbi:MAG: permease-like cell division protein FtsX [Actinomycetes bacterium]